MPKKYSITFWIIFWLVSAIALTGWFFFLQFRKHDLRSFETMTDFLPVSQEMKGDMRTLVSMADYVFRKDDVEKTFLILFENNMELRPGGGFIGSFGILKTKNGQLVDFIVHDTGNFDGRIPSTIQPPYPMKETLRIDSWKLRDSNYSPDFATNAAQAEEFYRLGQGQEQFDGVVAITTNVLASFLRVTGPVQVPGYPGEYTAENAVLGLEEQVERNFVEQGIDRGDRKEIMTPLGLEILRRVKEFDLSKKYELFKVVLDDLNRKDVQLFFKDENLQRHVTAAHWDGQIDKEWQDDYLMAVDANLGAFKSDYYVKRSMDYTVDFSGDKSHVKLAITYHHTATGKSWLTKDYQSYLRVYVPEGSWLTAYSGNATEPKFVDEFGKKVFGMLVQVRLGEAKTVTLEYDLPSGISPDFYDVKIQKQAGLDDVPVSIHIVRKNGFREDRDIVLNRDFVWSEI